MRKQYSPVLSFCLMVLVVAAMVCVMYTSSAEAGRSGYNSYQPDGFGGSNSVPTNGGANP
ncbi:unnamed protein product [Miscanthus lutarioriparius]|uniref:Uncharacterized protein n=1 Tax=Miscanthus lutarioriparius TaxID=422564 RepID=A0A811MZP4_9POAL|nr:unnamed protein product [Miscanthus lutarioriparius]